MPRNLDTRVELLAPVEDAGAPGRGRGHARALLRRRHLRLGAATRRLVDAAPRRHALGAPRADGARARSAVERVAEGAGPARRLSSSTRAAERATRAGGSAGERRAAASSRGNTSFQLARAGHQDQVGARGTERSAAVGDVRAVEHRLGLEAVGDRPRRRSRAAGAAGRRDRAATATRSGSGRAPDRARARP